MVSSLLKDTRNISAWATRKGDSIYKINQARFLILHVENQILYSCASDAATYPLDAVDLRSRNVAISLHGTVIRVHISDKERLFDFGDAITAGYLYQAMLRDRMKE